VSGAPPTDQLELIFEGLGHGLIRVDADLCVLSANRAAKRYFHPTKLVVGKRLPEPWPEVSFAELATRMTARYDISSRPQRAPAIIKDVASGERTFRITGFAPFLGSAALLHIEDRSPSERRLQAEREFVANAAHELLTPLTGIVTSAFALDAGAKLVPEERDRFIAHIALHADRLTRVARALLVLARAQSGHEPPRLETVALRPLLEDALAATNGDHDAAVTLHCPPQLEVFVDRDLAEQALTNLLFNAARHARGAHVTVSADEIGEHEVGIDVTDGGVGITPERIDQVAERFYSPAGRDGGGFGLGVSIAAQAIEVLGGSLTYASAPGGGTRARVRLRSGRFAHA
jgi:signal transduction histidine kinase